MMEEFALGFASVARGTDLVIQPGMRRYALLPLLFGVVFFILILIGSVHAYSWVVYTVAHHLPGWLAWSAWLLWIGFGAAFVAFFYYAYSLVVATVGLPFYMALTAAVQRRVSPRSPENNRNPLVTFFAGMVQQIPRFAYLGKWLLATLLATILLGWIPLVNFLLTPIWILFSSWVLVVCMSDFPLGARGMPFREQIHLIRQHKARCFGYGLACSLFGLLPVLQLLLMPVATAGITVLWSQVLDAPQRKS